ncbi:MAG: heat-inducible transcriptional repressor HrcA [Chloroflexi bacterium]|nr:heat-inducible transcriptional repressor HrcA [Chloroflexota bacterium]MCI0579432.1 heat-inducible transcriptional repressor HrcA [Chloroflexota bacterium]MCI0643375.1 heat-inducible transcriptional repressor HrcA [Chloroflexota bacterium]MCI0730076.1 heat-inducible transcriptional repressor HrcA [Chloroflexota bacterium]
MTKPLSERQEYILGLMVRTYVATGLPVGSKTLVEIYDLEFSTATVRNELAVLDEMGYLTQLHTSAGRIPTEKGYRYFVQRLIGEFELPIDEQQMIRHQFHQARLDLGQWMRLAAAVLAHTSRGASIVTAPRPVTNRFKHVQLISTQGRLVLMILVFFGGQVTQQMLTLAEPVPQAQLTAVAERLNGLFDEAAYGDIRARMSQLEDTLEREVARLILDTVQRADGRNVNEIYRDGLANILEDEGARQAVRVLEEGTYLADVLSETLEPSVTGVQVVIGGEGRWEELRDCTMILARYGVLEQLSGAVAVLGPTRMPYGRNISAVRYVADLMSGFVNEYYLEAPAANSPLPDGM